MKNATFSGDRVVGYVAAAAARTAVRMQAGPDWAAKMVEEAVKSFFDNQLSQEKIESFDMFDDDCLSNVPEVEPVFLEDFEGVAACRKQQKKKKKKKKKKDSVEEQNLATNEVLAVPTNVNDGKVKLEADTSAGTDFDEVSSAQASFEEVEIDIGEGSELDAAEVLFERLLKISWEVTKPDGLHREPPRKERSLPQTKKKKGKRNKTGGALQPEFLPRPPEEEEEEEVTPEGMQEYIQARLEYMQATGCSAEDLMERIRAEARRKVGLVE
jgi:hypothetical protein